MSSLGSSRWAPKPSTKLSENETKTPNELKQTPVPSGGFTTATQVNKSTGLALSLPQSDEVKQPFAKIDPTSYQDPTKMKTDVAVNKVEAAIQATRDRMAKLMSRHQDRPSTADRPIGRGSCTSYGGYTKRG